MTQTSCERLPFTVAIGLLCPELGSDTASASCLSLLAGTELSSHAVDRAAGFTEGRILQRGTVLHSLPSATILGASEASPISVVRLLASAAKHTENNISAERSEAQPEASASELPCEGKAEHQTTPVVVQAECAAEGEETIKGGSRICMRLTP